MKVNIGPYRDWIGPYQIADMVFFWLPNHIHNDRWDYKLRDRFGEWLADTWVNTLCEWIHSKKHRKIKIKIDRYDTWGMDHTLALIIIPMLKQIKETKHGSPFVDDKDVPKRLRSTSAAPKENEWDTDEFHHDRWDYVLDEMIWAFEQIVSDEDPWDMTDLKERNKRINNGTMLFGKYYRALWD